MKDVPSKLGAVRAELDCTVPALIESEPLSKIIRFAKQSFQETMVC
jgi:hypothetical protein